MGKSVILCQHYFCQLFSLLFLLNSSICCDGREYGHLVKTPLKRFYPTSNAKDSMMAFAVSKCKHSGLKNGELPLTSWRSRSDDFKSICIRRKFVETSLFSSGKDAMIETKGKTYQMDILSNDPKVFTIANFLNSDECQALIDRAKLLSEAGREMKKSNPPEVSISISKLWPLPILIMFAGIPPIIRLLTESNANADITMDQMIQAALPNLTIASILSLVLTLVTLQITRMISSESSRTSEALALNTLEDLPFIQSLVSKSCTISNIPGYSWENFEAPVITRYDTGAIFGTHNDASPTKGSEWIDLGGQRVVTIIIYLTTVSNGGETSFDRLNLEVKPKQGTALVFYPSDRNTLLADDRTRHESKVTLEGEQDKWIIQLFGRIGRVPPPLGILDEFSSFCT